jgi:hypothetical protein
MISAGLIVPALAQICVSGNWDVCTSTALLSSDTRDGRTDNLNGPDEACECVENAPRVHDEVASARPNVKAVRASASVMASWFCAGQARAPPGALQTIP